jgi:hypothetical protein
VGFVVVTSACSFWSSTSRTLELTLQAWATFQMIMAADSPAAPQ